MFEPLDEYQTGKHLIQRNHLKLLRSAVYNRFGVGVRRAVEVDRGFRIWKLNIQQEHIIGYKHQPFRVIHARIVPWNNVYYVVFGTFGELQNIILP